MPKYIEFWVPPFGGGSWKLNLVGRGCWVPKCMTCRQSIVTIWFKLDVLCNLGGKECTTRIAKKVTFQIQLYWGEGKFGTFLTSRLDCCLEHVIRGRNRCSPQ